jgi:hypothetical protein
VLQKINPGTSKTAHCARIVFGPMPIVEASPFVLNIKKKMPVLALSRHRAKAFVLVEAPLGGNRGSLLPAHLAVGVVRIRLMTIAPDARPLCTRRPLGCPRFQHPPDSKGCAVQHPPRVMDETPPALTAISRAPTAGRARAWAPGNPRRRPLLCWPGIFWAEERLATDKWRAMFDHRDATKAARTYGV